MRICIVDLTNSTKTALHKNVQKYCWSVSLVGPAQCGPSAVPLAPARISSRTHSVSASSRPAPLQLPALAHRDLHWSNAASATLFCYVCWRALPRPSGNARARGQRCRSRVELPSGLDATFIIHFVMTIPTKLFPKPGDLGIISHLPRLQFTHST